MRYHRLLEGTRRLRNEGILLVDWYEVLTPTQRLNAEIAGWFRHRGMESNKSSHWGLGLALSPQLEAPTCSEVDRDTSAPFFMSWSPDQEPEDNQPYQVTYRSHDGRIEYRKVTDTSRLGTNSRLMYYGCKWGSKTKRL